MTLPSFSLVGALEFRSVISSLQQEAAGSSLGAFEPLLTPFPGGHYHSFSRSRSRSGSSIRSGSAHTSEASSDVPLSARSPLSSAPLPPDDLAPSSQEEAPLILIDSTMPRIPEISYTPASPLLDTNRDVAHLTVATRHQGVCLVLTRAFHILFPTLHKFHTKSLLAKVSAVFAAPSVFALTITLPVVVRPYNSVGCRHEKAPSMISALSTFEEDGIERTLIAEEQVLEEMHELQFNKWLMAVQCAFGPLFCAAVLFSMLIYLCFFLSSEKF